MSEFSVWSLDSLDGERVDAQNVVGRQLRFELSREPSVFVLTRLESKLEISLKR